MNDQEKAGRPPIEEVAELRRCLNALIDNLPEGFLIVDFPDAKLCLASRYGRQMIGVSWDEVKGIRGEEHFRFYQMLHADGSPASLEQLPLARALFAGEVICSEEWLLQVTGGRRIPILCHAGPVRDEAGTITSAVLSWHDVTDRKKAELALKKAHDELEERVNERTTELQDANEQLRQSHEELSLIYDEMADGLLVADVETKRFCRANPSMCRMLGYSEEELLSLTVMDIHPPEIVPIVLEKFRTQQEGQRHLTENRPILRKDGTVFFADISNTRISCHGRPCIIGLFRDITERKRAHELLQREYRTVKHLLESSDHERQLIAYEIHDGLAQQLAGAIMQFQTYGHLRGKQPALAAKAYDAAMTMLQQGHHDARRLIAGVRPPILDESGVVTAVSHLVNEQSGVGGPKIEYRSRIHFDRLAPALENAIYRIAQEGLANACRHSRSKKIRVSLLQHEDWIQIVIRDWGSGFDTKAVPENGFGIEGIRQRTRLLGGKCSIRSRQGKGTRVLVELPVVLRH